MENPAAVATIEHRLPPEKPSANGPPSAHPNSNGLFEHPDALAALDEAIPILPTPPAEPAAPGGRKLLGIIVDVLVGALLIAIGVLCGEFLARQSTSEVLKDAGSAATFPPVDLLMWGAPTVVLLLIYALLISRGKSLGTRFRTSIQHFKFKSEK